ncbi:MAG: UPF0175 family protein [Nitrospirae bacterium]|nr:UPF0175 family protein [Nitrospirota bacterium]
MRTYTIEFPNAVHTEALPLNQELARYAVAGVLYVKGYISGKEAREITGDSRRKFEENMAEYGFSIIPDTDEDIQLELNA